MSAREQERRRQQRWASRRDASEQFGVSVRTIIRWQADPTLGFPKPKVIRGRVYFDVAELDAFDRREHARGFA